MKSIFWNFISVYVLLFIITFEFEYSILPNIYQWINPFFEVLISISGTYLFALENGFNPAISSDSIGLYIHIFNLVVISLVIVLTLQLSTSDKEVNLRTYLLKILTYYLSLQLLIYGLDKVFKAQFFLPEPNTLFTPLKDISKDLLYWSTIGISRSYSMFLGIAEVLTALFLLYKKTRLLGIIFGIGIMINVVAINFSFDISVKVYSLFLLSGFILLASPYFGFLNQVFIQQKSATFPEEKGVIFNSKLNVKKGLKWALILLFVTEGLFPFIATQNFNDDTFPRPKFHGAYEIINSDSDLDNVFVHRSGYLIFQNTNNEFQDFQLEVDTLNKKLLLFDYEKTESYEIEYLEKHNKIIKIWGMINNQNICFNLKLIEHKNSRLLQDEFNWTVQ